jgi:hypothetical protein
MYGDTVGEVPEPGELPLEGFQLNIVILKNVATKVLGRKRVASTVMVFMAVLSCLLEAAMAALYSASLCAMTLSIWTRVVVLLATCACSALERILF